MTVYSLSLIDVILKVRLEIGLDAVSIRFKNAFKFDNKNSLNINETFKQINVLPTLS